MRIFINVRNSIRKIIKESLKPTPKVGDFLYCHTEGVGPKVGDYVEVTNFEPRGGNRGEDIIGIGRGRHRGARFTIQKDENGRNYEDWFTLIPSDIQNIDFFGQLYESEEYEIRPKVGDWLYCHTDLVMKLSGVIEATAGRSYKVLTVDDRMLTIRNNSNHIHQFSFDTSNYKKWFTLAPPDIQNMDFFKGLYESEDDLSWVKDLDSTNLLKVGQKFSIPSKIPGGSPILAVITKVTDRVVYILPANLPASYPSKGTPFDIGKLLKILNSGAWKVVESNLNESREGKGYIVLTFNPPIEAEEDYEHVTSSLLAIYPNLHWLNDTSIKDAPTTISENGGVHYFVFNKSTNTVYYGKSPHEYDLSTNHDIIDGRDLINQNFNVDDVFTKLYESEEDFGWVKDIPFPHGYAVDLCGIEGDRQSILNQVFDKLERDGYTKERLDYYRRFARSGDEMILYIGSNFSKDGKKGLEYDHCHAKRKFVNGIYDREIENHPMPQLIPQYRLISYKDFLGI